MKNKTFLSKLTGWFFGVLFLAVGLINTFWGNDPFFGLFIVFISIIYLPPANDFQERFTRRTLPPVLKILSGLFVIWAALGVGELFDKIHLMLADMGI